MRTVKDYKSDAEIQWCPGCPNHGILQAVKKALVELDKGPDEVCLVSGIGQAAKLPHYLRCNFFNGLHGRAISAALGIHVANPELTTIVTTGDGDCYGEGGNHFIHAIRRNPDITLVVHNNEFYALTLGQASPTTLVGKRRALHPKGVEFEPLNVLSMAISQNCGYVARGFAGDVDHLTDLVVEAVKYPGFALVDVIQPCITWGTHPVSWYKERVYKLGDDYDPESRDAALEKSAEFDDSMPLGILYRAAPRSVYASRFRKEVAAGPLAELKPLERHEIVRFLLDFRPGQNGA
jgi:2-oxoglutarate ferredoxin oxidoreductase subunit beta